jgi:hypothetical protein
VRRSTRTSLPDKAGGLGRLAHARQLAGTVTSGRPAVRCLSAKAKSTRVTPLCGGRTAAARCFAMSTGTEQERSEVREESPIVNLRFNYSNHGESTASAQPKKAPIGDAPSNTRRIHGCLLFRRSYISGLRTGPRVAWFSNGENAILWHAATDSNPMSRVSRNGAAFHETRSHSRFALYHLDTRVSMEQELLNRERDGRPGDKGMGRQGDKDKCKQVDREGRNPGYGVGSTKRMEHDTHERSRKPREGAVANIRLHGFGAARFSFAVFAAFRGCRVPYAFRILQTRFTFTG